MSILKTIDKRIKKALAITPATWKFYEPVFRLIPKVGPFYAYPVIGPILKMATMIFPPKRKHTQTYVLNLNEDVTELAQGVVLPIDMMKQLVSGASHRVIIDKCMCRTANGCKDFPHDHACIFMGDGAIPAMLNGVGHEASVEEALAHIDKGAMLGLIGHALWIEFEQYVWGIEDMSRWLEVCFCCPCCCSPFKLSRSTTVRDIKERFNSIGWKARINEEACNLCGECVGKCPVEAISLKDGRIVIDEKECLGCGFCAARCTQSALKLHLLQPLKGSIKDYFTETGLKLNI